MLNYNINRYSAPLRKLEHYDAMDGKAVSFNKKQCFCVKSHVAAPVVNKVEYTTSNKMERAITGEMIKETCIPIKVDRLGNITEINGSPI